MAFSFNTFSKEDYKITKPIRLIELFAGIGAQAKALERLGANFEKYRVCEFDKYAIKSYNAVHHTSFEVSDITNLKGEDLGIKETDKYEYIMTYSFPCQSLSIAGLKAGMERGSGTRSGLLWEVERLLKETDDKPQVLLMENVPLVHGVKNISAFNDWLSFLSNLGYSNYYKDLNAKDYGVAQNRNRCFMVSILGNENFSFPKPEPLLRNLHSFMDDEVDEKYYIKRPWHFTQPNEVKHDLNEIAQLEGINFKVARSITDPNMICRCLDTMSGGMREPKVIVKRNGKDVARKLTPKECWRLMGFLDEDVENASKVNSDSQLYKQSGNSIVVDVLMKIFEKML